MDTLPVIMFGYLNTLAEVYELDVTCYPYSKDTIMKKLMFILDWLVLIKQ